MAAWTQIAAVLYMLVFLSVLIILHRRFHRAGYMQWDAIKLCDVTRSARDCVTPAWMALFRLSVAVYVFIVLGMAISRPVLTNKVGKPQLLGGITVLATFTMWSWTLIGVYGLVTGTVSACEAAGVEMSGKLADVLARSIWVAFQVLTSMAILVCLVVWLVLVPVMPALAQSFVPLSAHNMNVVFMVAEMLLNRMPFVHSHVLFGFYYGSTYIVFSWFYCLATGVVFYFFMDWRKPIVLGGYTVLIAVLYLSFAGSRRLSNYLKKDLTEEVLGTREVLGTIVRDVSLQRNELLLNVDGA